MSDSEYAAPPCSHLPDDLRILRWHLKQAIVEIDKFTRYNESGKRFVVEAADRHISDAFKRLNHFNANAANEPCSEAE